MRSGGGISLLVLLGGFVLAPVSLRADGGLVCLCQISGSFLVTVFITPSALRVGPVDLSVMVQDSSTRDVLLDAEVDLRLDSENGGGAINLRATRGQSTNKLLQSAVIDLPSPGNWQLTVLVRRGSDQAVFKTQLEVAPPLPRFISVLPLVALPPLVVLLFAGHQVLKQRRFRYLEQ
jgi:hypothetical protein